MNNEDKKVERYAKLIENNQCLIRSSRGMIRKKRTPLARGVQAGNLKSIKRAAYDKLMGSITKYQKRDLCRLLCRFRNLASKKNTSQQAAEIKEDLKNWFIRGALTIIDAKTGLIISLLWVIKNHIEQAFCKCSFDGACLQA
ncbi:hypothetical protein [Halomonas sp. H5]|uniref:hypothetical protein n=1 Tax=Halomonas sp. H5 TaxID=3423910 RepID=UPI003D36268A